MTNALYANNPNGNGNAKKPNNDIYFHYYLVKVVGNIAHIRLVKYPEDPIYMKVLIPPYDLINDIESYAKQIASLRIIFNGRWMGFSKLAEFCQKYRWQVIDEA